jgi:hypothetical protein
MRQDDSRRPVWEFAHWVQITRSMRPRGRSGDSSSLQNACYPCFHQAIIRDNGARGEFDVRAFKGDAAFHRVPEKCEF